VKDIGETEAVVRKSLTGTVNEESSLRAKRLALSVAGKRDVSIDTLLANLKYQVKRHASLRKICALI
jgi:hypothetical protein